jgi:hypothetical protein
MILLLRNNIIILSKTASICKNIFPWQSPLSLKENNDVFNTAG